MKNKISVLIVLVLSVALSSCGDSDSAVKTQSENAVEKVGSVQISEQPESDASTQTVSSESLAEPPFKPEYIYTVDLGNLLESDARPTIFDVRSVASFEKSHIESALSMPFGRISVETVADIPGLEKDSDIVTYCGCPRHLSTLAAKDLTDLGFSSVRVLYEGYWHWKDNGYPVVETEGELADLSTLDFQGVVIDGDRPISNTDVFLVHEPSGQMEAARTDAQGNFSFAFHIYDYKSKDEFELLLSSLDSEPVTQVTGMSGITNVLEVKL